jgi:GT2 family glycosyltransferase
MPEYINPNSFIVHLTGPDGIVIRVKPHSKVVLPEYFDRYKSRGFIKLANQSSQQVQQPLPRNIPLKQHRIIQKRQEQVPQKPPAEENSVERRKIRQEIIKAKKISQQRLTTSNNKVGKIVGRKLQTNATELLQSNLENNHYPISNNIGVGILSYNRRDSLKRLVDSIIRYTDLRKTTIFISDDCSTDSELLKYLDSVTNNFTVIKNSARIGVAGNSNRLLRCLSRFKYGILLNDDVEILQNGWEKHYADAMCRTNMHHFTYTQVGVYGAKPGEQETRNGTIVRKSNSKPHGAVLAFTNSMLQKCGYFDESYGTYGMEHVDWSQKAWEMGLQDKGFFDVNGSDKFYKTHAEKSSVDNKDQHLKNAKAVFENRSPVVIVPTNRSAVDDITYIIPFRETGRNESIISVVNNIRAQRFPVINILLIEQDIKSRIEVSAHEPVGYHLVSRIQNPLFNKSLAFNFGVDNSLTSKVVLHDADMLVQGHYTREIWNNLEDFGACHIGGKVIYANEDSTRLINSSGIVSEDVQCERVIGYFEGGSLACTVSDYWKCGGFNEDFWGYGCEDCDFYARLSASSRWSEKRTFDLLHLWHPRVHGWNEHHNKNKTIESQLKAISMEDRIKKQYIQLNNNGYSKSFERYCK